MVGFSFNFARQSVYSFYARDSQPKTCPVIRGVAHGTCFAVIQNATEMLQTESSTV